MSADDSPDEEEPSGNDDSVGSDSGDAKSDVRNRIEEGADRAAQQIDESVVDLLAWVLDTETRARIYVELRQRPGSTSEEIADGTGLYPSTVREALAELHEEGKVERHKRQSDGAGNNPYEYRAMAPTDLVRDTIGDVQRELNTVFNLDNYLGGEESEQEPVTINVEEETDIHDDVETSVETAAEAEDDDAAKGDDATTEDDATNDDTTTTESDTADVAGDTSEDTEMVDATDDASETDEE